MIDETTSFVTDEATLRGLHYAPMSRATNKVIDHIDKHCRAIVELSPFCVIATQSPAGSDVSPRGDPPGFVKIIDKKHLLLPDRVGNNRLDSMANILIDPTVGLLFFVPGMGETLRINGTAQITNDERLLEPCTVQGRAPKVALLITVVEAFLHCSKALTRSQLWKTEQHIDRSILPSYTEMLMDHASGLTLEENDKQSAIMDKRGIY